jgi:hypothetical protein
MHDSTGIRTHDSSVGAMQNYTLLILRGHWGRKFEMMKFLILIELNKEKGRDVTKLFC